MANLNEVSTVRDEVIIEKVNQILYNRLGMNIGPGKPSLESYDNKQVWVVPLLADYPRIIKDQKTEVLRYVIYHLGEIGEIRFDAKNAKPLEIPRRSSVNKTIASEMLNIRKRIEDLLLRTASINYAKLLTIKHIMSPLLNLITEVLRHDRFELPSLETKYGQSIYRYIALLEKRSFVRSRGDFLVPSPDLTHLFEEVDENYNRTQEYVLKDLIENEYDTIYRKYRIRVLFPYIRVPSTYYDYAISAQDMIEMSEEDLWNAYSITYGYSQQSYRRRFRFTEWLRELCQDGVELLSETTKRNYEGNQEIFTKMLEELPKTQQSRTIV